MNTVFLFPDMFRNHIENSRLKQPEDYENYDPNEYPHFHVFMSIHLANTIDVFSLKENANTIADIPEGEIRNVTIQDLIDKGVYFASGDLV